jgi:hypothetical protein
MGLRMVETADMVELGLQRREAAVFIFSRFGVNEINDKFIAPYKTLARPLLFAFLAWQQTFPSACPPSSHHSRNEVRSPFYCFCCSFLCWRVCSVVDPQHAVSPDHCFFKNVS